MNLKKFLTINNLLTAFSVIGIAILVSLLILTIQTDDNLTSSSGQDNNTTKETTDDPTEINKLHNQISQLESDKEHLIDKNDQLNKNIKINNDSLYNLNSIITRLNKNQIDSSNKILKLDVKKISNIIKIVENNCLPLYTKFLCPKNFLLQNHNQLLQNPSNHLEEKIVENQKI